MSKKYIISITEVPNAPHSASEEQMILQLETFDMTTMLRLKKFILRNYTLHPFTKSKSGDKE